MNLFLILRVLMMEYGVLRKKTLDIPCGIKLTGYDYPVTCGFYVKTM